MECHESSVVAPLSARIRQLDAYASAVAQKAADVGQSRDGPGLQELAHLQNDARRLAVDLHSVMGDLTVARPADPAIQRLEADFGAALDALQRAVLRSSEVAADRSAGETAPVAHSRVWGRLPSLSWLNPCTTLESTSVVDDIADVCRASGPEEEGGWSSEELDDNLVERRCLVPLSIGPTQELVQFGDTPTEGSLTVTPPPGPHSRTVMTMIGGTVGGLLLIPVAVVAGATLGPALALSGTGMLTGAAMAVGLMKVARCACAPNQNLS